MPGALSAAWGRGVVPVCLEVVVTLAGSANPPKLGQVDWRPSPGSRRTEVRPARRMLRGPSSGQRRCVSGGLCEAAAG